MSLVDDAVKCCSPTSAPQFLASVPQRSVGQMAMYVILLGLLPLIGSIIGGAIGWGGLTWGVVSGIFALVTWVIVVLGTGFALSAFGSGIVGKKLSFEEATTVVGYAATPAIIIGFITEIIAGLGIGLALVSAAIGFVALIYVAWLLFMGSGLRFGKNAALGFTVLAIILFIIVSFVIGLIEGAIITSLIWGNAMQYANNLAATKSALGAYGGGYSGSYFTY